MRQGGFTPIGVLFLVVGIGVGLAAVGTVWQTSVKREKEQELLFVGNQYRQAIASYYQRSPGSVKQYPRSLADLLEDPRSLNTVRHLRRLYRDPITGEAEWGLARDGQGIVGVHSLSHEEPLKKSGFDHRDTAFEGKAQYSDWVFAFKPMQSSSNQSRSTDQSQSTPERHGPGFGAMFR